MHTVWYDECLQYVRVEVYMYCTLVLSLGVGLQVAQDVNCGDKAELHIGSSLEVLNL